MDKMDKNEVWNISLGFLKDELSEDVFDQYIKNIIPLSFENDIMVLKVASSFHKETIENIYVPLLVDSIRFASLGKGATVKIVLDNGINDTDSLATSDAYSSNTYRANILFNPKYTFDTFIIGPNNKFAYAASEAVANSPSTKYNPLFIYGGVGLGKTHLMHAISQHILKKEPTKRVVYVSSEKFTNEFIDAIRNNSNIQFRNKYRNVDVLLIDDIQFLAGKTETQEEFFHTFNDLHSANKQIIITSDRPPREIPTLQDRLSSRFAWGLICDVSAPDFETRVAILKQKAMSENFIISDDILFFIADNIKSNIRDLEGVLLKVKALSEFNDSALTIDFLKEHLKDIIVVNNRKITMDIIVKEICSYYSITLEDIKSNRRMKQISYPRQIAMYLCRELTDNSLPVIGDFLGGRDHSTIIHGHDKIKKDMDNNINVQKEIERFIDVITSGK